SEEYCQIAILFLRHFRPALVSVDYNLHTGHYLIIQKIPTIWSGFSGDYEKYLGLGVGQNSNNHREFVFPPPHS
ncbi:hypothetical protein ACJBW8_10955, partial [Streptococcus suis]|nr:hypothetical protein [Streptococcus suis]MCL4913410.1 hypothetical protein [Streptococcus suis]